MSDDPRDELIRTLVDLVKRDSRDELIRTLLDLVKRDSRDKLIKALLDLVERAIPYVAPNGLNHNASSAINLRDEMRAVIEASK
jgi:hypothetical protein